MYNENNAYKELSKCIEKEYIENIEKAIYAVLEEVAGFEDCRRSANLQAVLTEEEFKDFEKHGEKLAQMTDKMIELFNDEKYIEAAIEYQAMYTPSDALNSVYQEVVNRIEGEHTMDYINIPYITFINSFGEEELRYDYWETLAVLESEAVWYVSWLDNKNTRRFIPCKSKLDAQRVVMSTKGLGRDNIFNKMSK